jgi:hypothetical protein
VVLAPQMFVPLVPAGLIAFSAVLLARLTRTRALLGLLVLIVPLALWQGLIFREAAAGVVPDVLDARPEEVRAIVLSPIRPGDPKYERDLVHRTVRVTDRATIAEVLSLLHQSEGWSGKRLSPRWYVKLGVEYDHRTAMSTVQWSESGVTFALVWGLVLAERKQDALGPVLERIAAEGR